MPQLCKGPKARKNSYSPRKLANIDDHVKRILNELVEKQANFEELCNHHSRDLFEHPMRIIKEMIGVCEVMITSMNRNFTKRNPTLLQSSGELLEYLYKHEFETVKMDFLELFNFQNVVCTSNDQSLKHIFQFDDCSEPQSAAESHSTNDEEYSIPDSVLEGSAMYVPTPLKSCSSAPSSSAKSHNMQAAHHDESPNKDKESNKNEQVSTKNAD